MRVTIRAQTGEVICTGVISKCSRKCDQRNLFKSTFMVERERNRSMLGRAFHIV